MRDALFQNLDCLGKIAADKVIELFPGRNVNIRVEYGGDEAWLRLLMGLLTAKEALACLKCLWLRGTDYDPQERVERVVQAMSDLHTEGELDQANPPLISNCTVWNLHSCAMHAILAFSKDILGWTCNTLASLPSVESIAAHVAVKSWFKQHNITGIRLEYPSNPPPGPSPQIVQHLPAALSPN